MSDTIAQLLNRLAEEESSLAETCAKLAVLVQGAEANAGDFATRVRTERAAGRLRDEHARALLDVLQSATSARTHDRLEDAPTTLQRNEATALASHARSDRTEVIAERRVQSLEDIDAKHRGALAPGHVVKARFVLDALIGKGGMGLVFSALDRRKQEARDPNPRVALKVLNSDFRRHAQSFIALQREARKAQTLAHPNVVTVFDFDRDGDVVYMTMELLIGRSLESIVRDARGRGIGAEQALPIIRGIAEGLAYAHRKGIVHSDLKPGNVFITQDGTPKILDFGISRAVPSSLADDAADVFDAGSLGAYTEAYATNEMVEGLDPHPADDMYALGIIAYELLSGRHPYQRHSAPNARKLGIELVPLKGVKRKEAQAIYDCLSFDREDRPQDAGEFLKRFRGISTAQRATAIVAVLLAIVAGYASYRHYVETSPSIPFAELPLEQQRDFREYIEEGKRAWAFYEGDRIDDALNVALVQYAHAYRIHPRNREAVAGLKQVAKAILAEADTDERRQHLAIELQKRSEFFRTYAPVVEAAK